ncbi:RNA polymerase-associated protein RTF1 [Pelomyxa schiedti]|nr:RNA polymerase-associated protein RTF1 [Pelomyxa schiedti]
MSGADEDDNGKGSSNKAVKDRHRSHSHHSHRHSSKVSDLPKPKPAPGLEEGEILDDRRPKKRKLAGGDAGDDNSPTPSEESDSSEDYHDEWDDELKGDEADRQYLDSLSDLKREQVLAERYEQRKRNNERLRIRTERRSTTPAKSKSEIKPSSRQLRDRTRKESSADVALKAIKEKRAKLDSVTTTPAEKQSSTTTTPAEKQGDKIDVPPTLSNSRGAVAEEHKSSPHGSPAQEILPPSPSSPPTEETSTNPEIMSFAQMLEIQLLRSVLIKWVNEPFFEQAISKGFVRVSLGTHMDKNTYRVAVVVGVQKGSPYPLDLNRPDTKETDIHLVLQTSQNESTKNFPIFSISDQPLTESEYEVFTRCAVERRIHSTYLSQQIFCTVRDNLQWARTYQYSEADYRLKEMKAQEKAKPVKKAALIQSQLDEAIMAENAERVQQLKKQLADLRETEKPVEAVLYPKKPARLVLVDSSSSSLALNPCQRRRTMPEVFVPPKNKLKPHQKPSAPEEATLVGNTSTTNTTTTTPTTATSTTSSSTTTSVGTVTVESINPGSKVLQQEDYAESMMKAHDFELDIDISKVDCAPTFIPIKSPPLPQRTPPPASRPPSQGLTLADYKRLKQANT